MVLPVPLSPANSALMPRPRAPLPAKPQSSYTASRCRTCAAIWRSVGYLRLGQHQVVPAAPRLDALRQLVEAAARRGRGRPATAPHRASRAAASVARKRRARVPDGLRAEPELRRHAVERAVQARGAGAQRLRSTAASARPRSGLSTAKRSVGRSMRSGSRAPRKIRPPTRSTSRAAAVRRRRRTRSRSALPSSAASRCHSAASASSSCSARRECPPRAARCSCRPSALRRPRRDVLLAVRRRRRAAAPPAARRRARSQRLRPRLRRRRACAVGHRRRQRMRAQQRTQARVEVVDAGQVVQHALVDAQAAAGQRLLVLELEQAPAPQRAHRRERAPVRLGQHGEREPEGGARPARRAAPRSTRRGSASISTPAQQQQQVALEGAQAEDARRAGRWPRAQAARPARCAHALRSRPARRRRPSCAFSRANSAAR